MNRQRGMSSLLLVLLVLALGSLILQGMSAQQQSQLSQMTLEKTALQESAEADTLLEWGRFYRWPQGPQVQCQQPAGSTGRVCLRLFADDTVLLMATRGQQNRWQTGTLSEGKYLFDPNGWSDFCPRKEATQCQTP